LRERRAWAHSLPARRRRLAAPQGVRARPGSARQAACGAARVKAFYANARAAGAMEGDGARAGRGGRGDALCEDGIPAPAQIGPLRKSLGLPPLPDGWVEDVATELEEAVRRRTLELADSGMEMPYGEASRPHVSRYIAVEILSTVMMSILKEALADISEHVVNEVVPAEEKARVLAELAERPEKRKEIFAAAARGYLGGGRNLL